MSMSLTFVQLQHPWYKWSDGSRHVRFRGRNKEDCSGFTRAEATALLKKLIIPKFSRLSKAGITRKRKAYRSGNLPVRDIVICQQGNELLVFPEHPTVTVTTAKWRSHGLHHRTNARTAQPSRTERTDTATL